MKTLYILIGLKGSGKTYIGKLIENKFNIPFLRVENIFAQIKGNRSYLDESYIKEGFTEVEKEIRNRFASINGLTIESTGLTGEFKEMLERLKKDFSVKLIKIQCDPKLCLKRVTERDGTDHINVSDSDVEKINELAMKVEFEYNEVIENNYTDNKEIGEAFEKLLAK